MRLDRFLAETGFGTRSEVKKIIRTGIVTINDEPVTKPDIHVDCEKDTVSVNGETAIYRKFIYLMMNKPAGYVSATWDKKLPTVLDLVPEEYLHFELFPVGRLDIDTEGLLVLTNDGALSHRLLSPKSHVPKTYIAKTDIQASNEDIQSFKGGITLDDGYTTMPADLKIIQNDICNVEITIQEGKYHQIKRMFESVGKKVLYLKRVRMNELTLDENLSLGDVRELTEQELTLLSG